MAKMSAEAKETLNKFNAKQSDWYTVCPKCGGKFMGTIKELKAHTCKDAEE